MTTTTSPVAERLALGALDYPIPTRANRLDFMLGALTLAALTLLGFTGIVLTQFYDPTPLSAHQSVRYVITNLPLVTFVRDFNSSRIGRAVAEMGSPQPTRAEACRHPALADQALLAQGGWLRSRRVSPDDVPAVNSSTRFGGIRGPHLARSSWLWAAAVSG